MATKPVDKGFSVNRFDGNGSETVWEFSFEGSYINREYVKAYTYNPQTRVETPVVFEWINDFSIRVVPAVPAGMELVVFRDTPKDTLLVDFRAGALRTPENLHKDFTQALNVATEAMDEANSMTAAADYAVDTAELALSVANMASSSAATAVVIAEGAESTAVAAEGAAAQAVSTANTARNIAEGIDAQVKDAVSKATSAVSTANSAQSTANAATTTANTAKATAEGIDAKATAAVSTANTAKSTADTAKSTADAVDAKATAAQNSAALAAAQAQTAANDAAAAAAAVAGKADKAYADAIKSTADQAKAAAATAQTTADQAKTAATAAQSTANQAKATADAAMPKSGGTLTGTLTAPRLISPTVNSTDDLLMFGGQQPADSGYATDKGAGLVLRAATYATGPRRAELTAATFSFNGYDLGRWAAIDPASKVDSSRAVVTTGLSFTDSYHSIVKGDPTGNSWAASSPPAATPADRTAFIEYGARWSFHQNIGTGPCTGAICEISYDGVNAADFHASSDARLKENISEKVLPLEAITPIHPVEWDWKDGTGHSSGAIAQEIQTILPELVHEGDDGMLSLSEGKAALVIALSLAQHLKAANERIAYLERALYGR